MLEVPEGLRRTGHRSEAGWLKSAYQLIELVSRECGLDTLATAEVLDVGCGTKVTKALLDGEIPIGRYVGIDVDPRVIRYLQANVSEPNFEFHHIDVRNDFYNPNGRRLADRHDLPVDDAGFDVIWLFSVFTHLGPEDYVAMLRLLRRYVRSDGWLVFSLFINERTDTGVGAVDRRFEQDASPAATANAALRNEIERLVADKGEAWFAGEVQTWLGTLDDGTKQLVEAEWQRKESGPTDDTSAAEPLPSFIDESGEFRFAGEPPDYVELMPDQPLLAPLFSRRHAVELFEGTGWEIVSLNPPEPDYIQHYFVCRPA
jgi:SAM-dependent methyltransferase